MIATMIIKDENGGAINVTLDFDPPVTNDTPDSPATRAAMIAMEAIARASKGQAKMCCSGDGEVCCDCGACSGKI